MATVTERLRLLIESSAGGAITDLRQVGDAAKGADGSVQGLQRTGERVTGALKGLGIAAAGLFSTQVIADFVTDAIGAASDLNETVSKARAVFGDSANAAIRFGDTAAESLGQSKRQAIEAVATFGNLFVAMGIGQQKSLDLSKNIVQLATDLSSFNNVPVAETLEALRSGLVGETEPLRRFGVNLNQATIEAKAMALGLYDGNGAIDASAKAQAAYALILEQTTTAQGDFARTSQGAANQQKILAAQFEDLKAEIGTELLPVFVELLGVGVQFARGLERIIPLVVDFGGAVVDVIGGALKPFTIALDPLADLLGLTSDEVKAVGHDFGNLGVTLNRINSRNAVAIFESLTNEATGIPKASRALQTFITIAQQSPAAAQLVIEGLRAQGQSTDTYERALVSATAATKDQQAANERLGQSTEDVTKAQDDLNNALLAVPGTEIAVERALLNQKKANEDLNRVMSETPDDIDAVKEAELRKREADLNVVSSILAFQNAQTGLDGNLKGQTVESLNAAITRLENLESQYPETAGAVEPLLAKLREQRDLLNFLSGFHANPSIDYTFTINGEAVSASAADLQTFIQGVTGYSFAGGGFTDWPASEARLALLHGQELILNPEQQRRMLYLIDVLTDPQGDLRTAYSRGDWRAEAIFRSDAAELLALTKGTWGSSPSISLYVPERPENLTAFALSSAQALRTAQWVAS